MQMEDLKLDTNPSSTMEQQGDFRSNLYLFIQVYLHRFASAFGLSSHEIKDSLLLTVQDDIERIWYPFFGYQHPAMNQLALTKGLVTVLDDSILFDTIPTCITPSSEMQNSFLQSLKEEYPNQQTSLWIYPIGCYILHLAQHSTDNGARLSAVKTLDTLLGRLKDRIQAWILKLEETPHREQHYCIMSPSKVFLNQVFNFARLCLDICFSAWDNQGCRQVVNAIPDLFRSVLHVMDSVDEASMRLGRIENMDLSMEALTRYILMQPVHRKVINSFFFFRFFF